MKPLKVRQFVEVAEDDAVDDINLNAGFISIDVIDHIFWETKKRGRVLMLDKHGKTQYLNLSDKNVWTPTHIKNLKLYLTNKKESKGAEK